MSKPSIEKSKREAKLMRAAFWLYLERHGMPRHEITETISQYIKECHLKAQGYKVVRSHLRAAMYSACLKKVKFDTQADAESYISWRRASQEHSDYRKPPQSAYAYSCQYCLSWHITYGRTAPKCRCNTCPVHDSFPLSTKE